MRNNLCYWLLAGVMGATAWGQAPQVSVLPPISAGIRSPARVAVTPEGNILISEPGQGRVDVVDAFGRVTEVHGGLGSPLALAVDAAGRVYISDQKQGSVSVYDAQWNLVYKLGQGDREFGLPGDLALGSLNGTQIIYVCDSRTNQVKAYQEGRLAFSFGSYGTNAAQFDFPCGVHVSGGGELFVLDQSNDRVEVFDLQGKYLRQFTLAYYDTSGASAPRRSGRALGITGDPNNRIYVADGFQGHIKIFSAAGTFLGMIAGSTAAPFRTPAGMVVDRNNRLLVALANSGAVAAIGLDSYLGVTASPSTQVVAAGTTVKFTASAGGGPYAFQWRKGLAILSDGGNISGASGPVLQMATVTPADSGSYSVAVTGGSTALSSPQCRLTVLNFPAIVSSPTNQTILQNNAASFSVQATGDALAYQWQFNGNDIPGATAPVLTIPEVATSNAGRYQVRVSNMVGTALSSPATLDVIVPPTNPVLLPPSFDTNGQPALTILVQPNQHYTVETSTNLYDWAILTNLFNDTGTIELSDPSGSSFPRQFYRVRWSQP